MRIAIVHEWLVNYAGSERVVEQILKIFPEADLYALVDFLGDGERDFLGGRKAYTSFIQKLPFARRKFRLYLPLFPLAVQQFDLSAYDIVISSSHAVSKGVITGPDQLHVSYVHSPMRYAWDLQHEYLREERMDRGVKSWLARLFLHGLRQWDVSSSNGVDFFLANSNFVARRIRKIYRREAFVLPPPCRVPPFTPVGAKDDYYLHVGRLVGYKRVDLLVEAFNRMPSRRLVILGDGPQYRALKAKAGPNIAFLGFQDSAVVQEHMRQARAFLYAGLEDFGIVMVEALAYGTPVIAYGKGGALDIVCDISSPNPTGVLFSRQDPDSVVEAVSRFERGSPISPRDCHSWAMQFSEENFRERFKGFVIRAQEEFRAKAPTCVPLPVR
jgi:glycosyltransferase involved in cell wall biosynthesis